MNPKFYLGALRIILQKIWLSKNKKVKVTLVLIVSFLIFGFFIITNQFGAQSSKVTIDNFGNKFKIKFDISSKDQDQFRKLLQRLYLPSEIEKGIQFELDATSSALLSFAVPIKADFKINKKIINFSGSLDYLPQEELYWEDLKVPDSANLEIIAPDFRKFLKTKTSLPVEFIKWLDANLVSQEAQHLVVFGGDADILVIFKPQSLDFMSLQQINIKGQKEPLYKKRKVKGQLEVHLLNLIGDEEKDDLTVAIFQKGHLAYLIFSKKSAQKIIDFYSSLESIPQAFSKDKDEHLSFKIIFTNSQENQASDNFYSFIFNNENEALKKTLSKIERFEFILKGTHFSGLINIK